MGGEDREARVLQRDEAGHHVAVRALAADLLRVHARRLVAVVAVGDQQLARLERRGDALDRGRVGDAPQPVPRAVRVGDVGERLAVEVRLERPPRRVVRVVVQGEDGGEVGLRRARQPQAVLLGPGMRALVRADATGAVLLDADAREEAVARVRPAVRAGVVLGQGPERGLLVAGQDARVAPGREGLGGGGVGIVALRQVDLDDVVRRLAREPGALLGVDHVVGRGDDGADVVAGVVEGAEGADVGHAAGEASARARLRRAAPLLGPPRARSAALAADAEVGRVGRAVRRPSASP